MAKRFEHTCTQHSFLESIGWREPPDFNYKIEEPSDDGSWRIVGVVACGDRSAAVYWEREVEDVS